MSSTQNTTDPWGASQSEKSNEWLNTDVVEEKSFDLLNPFEDSFYP